MTPQTKEEVHAKALKVKVFSDQLKDMISAEFKNPDGLDPYEIIIGLSEMMALMIQIGGPISTREERLISAFKMVKMYFEVVLDTNPIIHTLDKLYTEAAAIAQLKLKGPADAS
jgi:hypothetical protein